MYKESVQNYYYHFDSVKRYVGASGTADHNHNVIYPITYRDRRVRDRMVVGFITVPFILTCHV